MKKPTFKKWELLEIDWVDSAHGTGWKWENEVPPSDEGLDHRTIGYFLKDGPRSITVVQSYNTHYSEEEGTTTDARMTVPRVAITKIRKLK